MKTHYRKIETPVGVLYLASDGERLRVVIWAEGWKRIRPRLGELSTEPCPIVAETERQLREYFAGKRSEFDLPLRLDGTEFQRKVWRALAAIPYGRTATYGEQADRIRHPRAVRAVGRTNGLNPISIVLPCHRVIGKSGALTGYAGGLKAKRFLLDLESSAR